MIHITRRERFNAAHRLFRSDFSDEKNFEVFGPCSNPNWHGHNYVMWVTIKGDVDSETGFLINLKQLSNILKAKVVEKIDHKNMNTELDFMKGKLASTENLAIAVWNEIEQAVREIGAELHCVKISETENNSVEYYG